MAFRRAILCEPLSPPERRREPTEGRLPSERVAPSPFKGRSRIFTIASVASCTAAMDIATRKERRHFLPPSDRQAGNSAAYFMVTQIGQRFKNRVVLVTGAAHGIGRAIALRFGSEGGQVIVNDVNVQGIEDTIRVIITNGGLAIPGIADVSDKSQVDHLFDTVLEHFGTVDVLVNNAGLINVERHFLEADEAWWDRVIDVNLKGVFLCSYRAAQVMARRHQGVIINMSSGGATHSHRGMAAYDASKGGIEALTRAMALDLAPYGIRVNAL